jgi:hypothetical protein
MTNTLEHEIDMRRRRHEYAERLRMLDVHRDKLMLQAELEKDAEIRLEINYHIAYCSDDMSIIHKENYWLAIELGNWKRENKRPSQLKPV